MFRENLIERKTEVSLPQEKKEKKEEEIIIVDKKEIERIRENSSILRIKKEKAKEFGINPERYSREITPEEIEKLVNEICEKNENLEKERLLFCIKDLHIKFPLYRESFDLLIEKISKFTRSQLSLKEEVAYLEGLGFCALQEENEKIKFKKIKPVLPGYIISPRILGKDFLEITSEVTGVALEKLEKDLEKVSHPQPQDFIKVIYGISSQDEIMSTTRHKKMIVPLAFKPSFSLKLTFTPMDTLHEIAHLESSLPEEIGYQEYKEGEAVIAEINGGKKLAEKWKDILMRNYVDLLEVLMSAAWLAEYLYKNIPEDKEIIKFLQKICPNEKILDNLFDKDWDKGKIDELTFEQKRKYFARAYEIAKFFGEEVKVSKISEKDWLEFLKSKRDYKKLFKYPFKPEFLHYSSYGLIEPSSFSLSSQNIVILLKEKLEILKAERKLFDLIKKEPHYNYEKRVLDVLKKVRLTMEERERVIQKEIKETEEKLNKVKKGDMRNIYFDDLFWKL